MFASTAVGEVCVIVQTAVPLPLASVVEKERVAVRLVPVRSAVMSQRTKPAAVVSFRAMPPSTSTERLSADAAWTLMKQRKQASKVEGEVLIATKEVVLEVTRN